MTDQEKIADIFWCNKRDNCQWKCFALDHWGFAIGNITNVLPAWKEAHERYCDGQLVQGQIMRAAIFQPEPVTQPARPKIVCLCGSTRFGDAFAHANLVETLAGNIVLSIGCNLKSDAELFSHLTADALGALKRQLDELHKRKIDLADEVLILNVGGYIGESTRSELEYAREHGKTIRYLEP